MRSVLNALIFGFLAMSLIAGLMSAAHAEEADKMAAPFVINAFVDKARLGRSPRESARAQHYARLTELNRSILDNVPKAVSRTPNQAKNFAARKTPALRAKKLLRSKMPIRKQKS